MVIFMAKKIAYSSILVALALILSYVEALIPINFGIPGVKLGLANLVIVIGLYFLNTSQVFIILITRIILVSFLFGNMCAMLYSLAGGIVSFAVMFMIKKINGFSIVGVSMAGGVAHNIGQLIVAALVVENLKLIYYLPVLMIAGTLTGMLIGIIAQQVRQHIHL